MIALVKAPTDLRASARAEPSENRGLLLYTLAMAAVVVGLSLWGMIS